MPSLQVMGLYEDVESSLATCDLSDAAKHGCDLCDAVNKIEIV